MIQKFRNPKIVNGILSAAYWIFVFSLVGIAAITVLSVVSPTEHFRPFVVQSGSMSPAIMAGSVIFTVPKENYSVGNIISFRQQDEESVVTHRIVDAEEKDEAVLFTTKGDANTTADAHKVSGRQIIGSVLFHIPYLGYPVSFAKTPEGFIALIVVPASIIVYSELVSVRKEIRKLMAKRKDGVNGA